MRRSLKEVRTKTELIYRLLPLLGSIVQLALFFPIL